MDFDEILKDNNTLYIYNYNFFYLCLAIGKQNTGYEIPLDELDINLSQSKINKFENLIETSTTTNKHLNKLLTTYYLCLRTFLKENTDKTDLESCQRIKSLVSFTKDIYIETLSILNKR